MSGLTGFLMHEVEMPLVPIVAQMEDTGYPVDVQFFQDLRVRLEPEIETLLAKIREVGGPAFNPNSHPQVSALLFEQLKLPIHKLTDSRKPSTDDETLKRLAPKHEIAGHLKRFRGLNKIYSTYCSIPDQVDEDGRLRVEFNQLAAETGRFSSASIIQTLPKNDEFEIRKGFRAPDGFQIIGADFRQQELNVLAQVSGDANLLAAIENGTDLHGLAAVKVYKLDCEPNEVEKKFPDKRDQIKAVQFGLIYGKTPFGLAGTLGITLEQAEQLISDYFKQFPSVQGFIAKVHRQLMRDGYVDDVFGRRRHFPEAKQQVPRKRSYQMTEAEKQLISAIGKAKRAAQNFVIQGASATITKLAMIRCHGHITATYDGQVKMILQLHDELQFEVREDLVSEFATELPGLMCNLGLERFGFKLPLAVEVKAGPSWGEMRKRKGCIDGNQAATNQG